MGEQNKIKIKIETGNWFDQKILDERISEHKKAKYPTITKPFKMKKEVRYKAQRK